MICFTTFIFTLFLSHIARAVCGDAASPKDLYDSTYDDVQEPLLVKYKVTWDWKYDTKNGDTKTVTCTNLATPYPKFGDIHMFPYIGGRFNVTQTKRGCQECWLLTYEHDSIYLGVIDHVETGFVISHEAFVTLTGGGETELYAEGVEVSISHCGF